MDAEVGPSSPLVRTSISLNIRINGTANNCADCMSRLQLPGQTMDSAEKIHVVVQMDDMPVTAIQIAKESKHDK